MRIGKQIKTVTSPQRKVQRVGEKAKPIPVQLPMKVPEKVTAWEVNYRFSWGMDMGSKDRTVFYIPSI